MLRWPFPRQLRLRPQAAYALWAETYLPRPHNPLMALEQQTVLSLLPELSGLSALDAGCGSGRYLRELRERGANAIGIDLSEAMLARAREVTTSVARADICALPLDSMTVDVIVCGLALGDVADLEIAVGEMARVLRPGGCVVYSVVHPVGRAKGWSRTFDARGRHVIIDGYWHTAEAHKQACAAAGLRMSAWEEPVLDASPHDPAILVVRATR
jgi:malonyl-CoA O-methyltransferase